MTTFQIALFIGIPLFSLLSIALLLDLLDAALRADGRRFRP